MPNTVRVLHIANALGLGGTEKVLQLFASHLDRRRFTPVVYSPEGGERGQMLRDAGVETHVHPNMLHILKQVRPHLVHVHRAGWPDPNMLRPLRGFGVPVVETNVFGCHDPSPWAKVITRHLFVSRFCAERYRLLHGIDTSSPRYRVVYNPVDTDAFARALPDGPDFAAPVVGRVSRPDPGKWSPLGVDFLPHALARVPGLEYRVIGGVPEAEERVRALGLEERVRFLPPVRTDRELADFYGGCSVLAHANDTGESFGLVIAEAMACGLPVVTHPCPPPRDNAQIELVEHGVTGFVAPTAEDFGHAVARLLADPELARRLGRAGREKAARLYRAQTVTRQLETIYDEALAEHRERNRT